MSPRHGLRDRWLACIYPAKTVRPPVKVLLLALGNYWMNDSGYVSVPQDRLAEFLCISPTRVSHMITEAKRGGLLAQIPGSGHKGRTAEYVAEIPSTLVVAVRPPKAVKGSGSATTNPDYLSVAHIGQDTTAKVVSL